MRLLRLTVEGFTSFRETQVIDFRPLDLFVITGPTGSGKTSILDAVTLALYGMVPRARKRDLKELISLGASQVRVELDFRVRDAEYRVARRICRQGPPEITLERIEGENVIPEAERGGAKAVNERIVEILGLDYKSFKTAVLLPQGDFASFLKGQVEDRRNILIRLLDLDRFKRAGALARERARDLRATIEAGDRLLGSEYGDATSEALEEARALEEAASKTAELAETAYGKARRSLSEWEKIRVRRDEIREVAVRLDRRKTALDALFASLSEQRGRDEETRAALTVAQRDRAEAGEARERARVAWRETEAETGGEVAVVQLATTARALAKAEAEIERREGELKRNGAALEEAGAHAEGLEAAGKSADAAEAEVARALKAASAARKEAEEVLRVARRADELDRERAAKTADAAGLREEIEGAEIHRREAARECDAREGELLDALTEHRSAGLRTDLAPGDECPVCGAAIGELPATDPEIESVLAARRSAVHEARKSADEDEKLLSSLRARLGQAEAAAETLERDRRELGGVPSPEVAEDARAATVVAETRADGELAAARVRVREVQDEIADAKALVARLEATGAAAEEARDAAWRKVEIATEQLMAGLGEPLPDSVEAVINARGERLHEAAEARKAVEETWEAAEAAYRTAEMARGAVSAQLAAADRKRREQRTLLGARAEDLVRLGVEAQEAAPPEAGDRAADTAALRTHVGELRAAAGSAVARLGRDLAAINTAIRAHAAGAGVDPDALDAGAAVSALDAEARAARRTADRHSDALDKLNQRLARKTEMEAEIEEKRGLMRRYEKLARELQKNNFIEFLLTESIEDLALRASHELLTISAGQYSLTSSGINFTIVDHANADERRSVVTLSGGETFLASLALALGLAGGIADIAGHAAGTRLDAMFIDEGFGTLDPESLDQAVEALERLHDGRRMVGIITHVPALADRIPDGLAVTRRTGHTTVTAR